MIRVNLYNSLIITFAVILPVTWLCRSPVQLPATSGEEMFRQRDGFEDDGYVEIELYTSISGEGNMLGQGLSDEDLDVLKSDEIGFGNRGMGPSSPMQNMRAPSRAVARDSGKSGLFDTDDSADSFSTVAPEADSVSWGWLADDIQTAERGALKNDSRFNSRNEDRRLFGNDDSLGSRFRNDGDSSGDSFFKREDLRW